MILDARKRYCHSYKGEDGINKRKKTHSLSVPEVKNSVMKLIFLDFISTHEWWNLMMFLCFNVFNK